MTGVYYRGLRMIAKAREEHGADAPLYWSVGPKARTAIVDGREFCGLPAFTDANAGDRLKLVMSVVVDETQVAA